MYVRTSSHTKERQCMKNLEREEKKKKSRQEEREREGHVLKNVE